MIKLHEIEEQIQLYSPKVRENIKIVSGKDYPIPVSLRIDEKLPTVFAPRMPASAASTEDNTVPRVVSAPTLIGCMSGHAHAIWLVDTREIGETGNNFYHISGFEFDYALKPNKKLVYDCDDSGELWHVTCNKDTVFFKHLSFGELFIHKVSRTVLANAKVNHVEVDICIKITDPRGAMLTEKIHLKQGHYFVKGDFSRYAVYGSEAPKRLSYKENDLFRVTPIKPDVYKSFRSISVSKKV